MPQCLSSSRNSKRHGYIGYSLACSLGIVYHHGSIISDKVMYILTPTYFMQVTKILIECLDLEGNMETEKR